VLTSNPADRSKRPNPLRTNGSSSTTAIRDALVAIGNTIGRTDDKGYYTLVTYGQRTQPTPSLARRRVAVLRQARKRVQPNFSL